ncbi:unnamed protein product [Ambrosiozyma monospora]|uniref:Unnamed protein product n=1 Tax=Ambrosiozyma monospora TaxID=43982 RepID=A0ACB5TDZ5_AMBMO|nr:unnamed protein product [Ambrosiozyma monospora]
MPPKRGLSLEEKRSKLLTWFSAEHTVYNIKEVETIASKRTGISGMQIKDILQSLLDDGLVNVEKCGTQNIYWVFKYDTQLKLDKEFSKYSTQSKETEAKIYELKAKLEQLKSERDEQVGVDGITRTELLALVEKLKLDVNSKAKDLSKSDKLSPVYLKNLEAKNRELVDGCEDLADIIETIISFVASAGGHNTSALKKELGVPEEFSSVSC